MEWGQAATSHTSMQTQERIVFACLQSTTKGIDRKCVHMHLEPEFGAYTLLEGAKPL